MRWGRVYFAVQSFAGALWWIAVLTLPAVRELTLGSLDAIAVAVVDIPLFVAASAVAALGVRWAGAVATGWTAAVAIALAVYATVTTEAGWGVLVMAAAAGGSVIALCLLVLGRIPTEWMIVGPFAFRPARPAPHVAITLLQMLVFWGFFLVAVPLVIAALERRWGVALEFTAWPVGIVTLAAASALGVWSALTMSVLGKGTPLPSAMPTRLVVAGPYRWVRNPMAVAGIVQGVAVGLILSSLLVVAYAVIGSLLWNYAVRPLEEADLERRFGEEYRRYRDGVRCWVPAFRRGSALL